MKTLTSLALLMLAALPASTLAQEQNRSIRLRPDTGKLTENQRLSLYFPEAVVAPEAIDREGGPVPIRFEPEIDFDIVWKSQTEAQLRITTQPVPGMSYTASLAPDLKMLDGSPVDRARWIDRSFSAAPLTVTGKPSHRGKLCPSSPTVALRFNYQIRFADAAKSIYFQDRDSRERFTAKIGLPGPETKPAPDDPPAPDVGSQLWAEPAAPLPADRTVDLIVENLRDAATGTPIPFVKSFPLGETASLRVEGASAMHSALSDPAIEIWFNQRVDIDSVTPQTVLVDPAVRGIKRLPSGYGIRLEGEFDPAGKYTVHLLEGLKGTNGYPLTAAVAKTVEFEGIVPSIYFPSMQYFARSGLGLKLKFLHANTGPVEWTLAPLPEHKIGVARNRLYQTGERLVDQLGLKPVASGKFPGAPTVGGFFRDIEWQPAPGEPVPSGVYIAEVSAKLRSGKVAANRALVFFNDVYVAQKQTGKELWAKVARMSDSSPVADARARLVSHANELLATAKTGADGIARFDRYFLTRSHKVGPRASHILIDAPGGGTATVFAGGATFYNSGWANDGASAPQLVGSIFSDRNLYRPGSSAKFKGILRHRDDGKLQNAPGREVAWKITEGYNGKTVAEGKTTTDEFGGWEVEWPVAKDLKLGGYRLQAGKAGSAYVRVEEYRVPLFEVGLSAKQVTKGDTVRVKVQSNYFHGGPNAGAVVRWSLDWNDYMSITYDGHRRDNSYAKRAPVPPMPEATGEFKLDNAGSGVIEAKLPEGVAAVLPRVSFGLDVDVISPEGRTISDGFYGAVQPVEHLLGVKVQPVYPDDGDPHLSISTNALDADDEYVDDLAAKIYIYRIENRTVKEKVGENIFRYRNFAEQILVGSVETKTAQDGEPVAFDVGGAPGQYVALGRLPGAPPVTARATLAGEAPARYAVWSNDGFEIQTDKEKYLPGDTAALALEAPFAGKAWVSVESDRVLEQFVVDLDHNASKIDLPIKPEYFPNAHATVYLVRPGGPDKIPAERFGRVELTVDRPDLQLQVKPALAQSQIEPGAEGSGTVFVTAGDQPVANADVTVMAVDEAVLRLGSWSLPAIFDTFYPYRPHHVSTHHALDNHHAEFDEEDVTEKGFLIGGGGPGGGQKKKRPRENMLARAFWKTQLRTDADGKVEFGFTAPDNLTEFRVTAIAHTVDHRFGHGQNSFQVNKRLMVEPALPRFVRHGDEIVLRAVARQTPMDEARIAISCTASEGLEILGDQAAEIGPLARDVPGTFGVRARVKPGYSEVKVRFDASIAGHSDITDEVQVTLPVHRPGVMQRTGLYGKVPDGAAEFVLAKAAPEFWPRAEGEFGLTLSRSPMLPKLQGLPELLEYPHGCLEQRSSKLLGYTQLAGLLEYLPDLGERHKNYRTRLEEGLRYFETHVRPDGFLGYWAGSGGRHAYVTVLASWVVAECRSLGYTIPKRLDEGLAKSLDAIIRGRAKEISEQTRAFALFVHSRSNPDNKPVDVLEELHLNRDRLGDESRAFLALAMKAYDVMPAERQLLVREIDQAPPKGAFDPRTFYSTTRARAVAYIAQTEIADPRWKRELEPEVRGALLGMLDDSRNLSTQENLWMLMSLVAMMDAEDYKPFPEEGTGADLRSKNGVSIGWKKRALAEIGKIGLKLDAEPIYYLVDASVLRTEDNAAREDRGLRVERVVKNLTDATRTGTAEKPYKLGDEVLVTFRLQSDRNHYYIALVDELPAGLETVNFNLAQVSQFYRLPEDAERNSLHLSHSELRDRSANLYFDRLAEGAHTYSVLARVTGAGQFAWPSTDVTPMYEPRFGALGAPSKVFAVE